MTGFALLTDTQHATTSEPVTPPDLRERFYGLLPELLASDPRAVALLADIGAGYIDAPAAVADRVINLGIREQLLVSAAGGLALAGMRPVVHTFAPFLVERPYEQLKLDLGHQGVGAVLVSAGGSYDMAGAGRPTSARATCRCSTPSRAGPCTCPGTPTRPRRSCAPPCPATTGSTSGCRARQRAAVRHRAVDDGAAPRGRGRSSPSGRWRTGRSPPSRGST